MFLKIQKILGMLCVGIFLYSCQKGNEVWEESTSQTPASEVSMIKLGKQLENHIK
ncbi:MAG: hypothetical protein Q4A09_06940 [Capnocytophaga felis]|nr:hypothetical protein [Capnocytophaga felis]